MTVPCTVPRFFASATWLGTWLLASSLAAPVAAQNVQRDCADCPELVSVAAGELLMGSSLDDYERDTTSGETPALALKIRRDFRIGRFEVTRREWQAFASVASTNKNALAAACQPTSLAPAAPITCIGRDEILGFLERLSSRTGHRYRLPSESEWEYAARAGSRGARFWSNRDSHEGVSISRACDYGNVYDVSARRADAGQPHARCADGYPGLAPVGSFLANSFGLYDTTGNARERVADCFTRSYKGRPADERAWVWSDCRYRAVRGGSYLTRPFGVRSAARDFVDDARNDGRAPDLGFRVARD
jgi:formylglycine-generating enzyme required for sulfatase activity